MNKKVTTYAEAVSVSMRGNEPGDEFYICDPVLSPTQEDIERLAEEAAKDFDRLSLADQKRTQNMVRLYTLNNGSVLFDLDDEDDFWNAMSYYNGYDLPYYIDYEIAAAKKEESED